MTKNEAWLIKPEEKYLDSYYVACRELKDIGNTLHGLHDPDEYAYWKDSLIDRLEEESKGIRILPGFVPSTTFWLVDGSEFIGSGNIRHHLSPSLEKFGGHIGYTIRPSRWNMGYGTHQLSLLLVEARNMGIHPILLTCDEHNSASRKVMEKNGGVYFDTVINMMGGRKRPTQRFFFY